MKNRRSSICSGLSAAILLCFAAAPSALADPTLYVNGVNVNAFLTPGQPSNTFLLQAYNSGGWSINMTVGMVTGTAGEPGMFLMYQVTSMGAGSPLTIGFSADNFGPTHGIATGSIGGSTNILGAGGSATFSTLVNGSNALNSGTALFADQTFGSGVIPATTVSAALNYPAFYSLTQTVAITHFTNGTSSGSYQLFANNVPEAASTFGLFGLALAALGVARRKLHLGAGGASQQ